MKKSISLEYDVFARPTDLSAADQELYEIAAAALPESYSPYSRFQVAAAARLENGEVVSACNTENAAYPMCLCAERAALAAAASRQPTAKVVAMAITVKSPSQVLAEPASPCGACRQVLAEHEQRHGHRMRIILRAEVGPFYVLDSAADLLPLGFSSDFL
ncbi:cytidine deaminase [Lewinellaceae bacterium SD302]|nr:cytidine deaminase [Lewinellaceae bacterium SD302]